MVSTPDWKGHIDLEPCPYYGLFSLWRSSEWTRDLPADGLSHTQFAVKRGQEDERLGAFLDFAANAPVFWVSVACVRHEARRQRNNVRADPFAEQ